MNEIDLATQIANHATVLGLINAWSWGLALLAAATTITAFALVLTNTLAVLRAYEDDRGFVQDFDMIVLAGLITTGFVQFLIYPIAGRSVSDGLLLYSACYLGVTSVLIRFVIRPALLNNDGLLKRLPWKIGTLKVMFAAVTATITGLGYGVLYIWAVAFPRIHAQFIGADPVSSLGDLLWSKVGLNMALMLLPIPILMVLAVWVSTRWVWRKEIAGQADTRTVHTLPTKPQEPK